MKAGNVKGHFFHTMDVFCYIIYQPISPTAHIPLEDTPDPSPTVSVWEFLSWVKGEVSLVSSQGRWAKSLKIQFLAKQYNELKRS